MGRKDRERPKKILLFEAQGKNKRIYLIYFDSKRGVKHIIIREKLGINHARNPCRFSSTRRQKGAFFDQGSLSKFID